MRFVGFVIMGLVGFVMEAYKLCHEDFVGFVMRVWSCVLSRVCHEGLFGFVMRILLVGFVKRDLLVFVVGFCWFCHEGFVGFVMGVWLGLSCGFFGVCLLVL